MLITHLFSQNNKVLALSSNAIFPKSPNISPLEPARIKEIPFDRGKQTQPRPAGRKHERADGQRWRLFTAASPETPTRNLCLGKRFSEGSALISTLLLAARP
jgi:hypothetical protein